MAGYGFATYRFAARRCSFSLVLGALMVPATALVIPTFMMFSEFGLTNTIWAVILPSLLNPFGVYLIHVYARDAVPDEILDAARADEAGEMRTFLQVAFPLMRPAVVTVLLLSAVASWNNYFLPLAMLSDNRLFPVTDHQADRAHALAAPELSWPVHALFQDAERVAMAPGLLRELGGKDEDVPDGGGGRIAGR
jgi:multiple sugar transport system permease protein